MATLQEIVQDVALGLKDPNHTAISQVQVRKLVNEAIQYYKRIQFAFNTTESVVNLAVGNPLLPVPAEVLFLLPDSGMVLIDGQWPYPMRPIKPFEYDLMDSDLVGVPAYYTLKPNGYFVSPKPQSVYPVVLRYVRDVAKFATDGSSDSSTNIFTTHATSMISHRATALGYIKHRQDPEMGAMFEGLAQNEYNILTAERDKRNKTGRLSVYDGVLDDVKYY